MKSVKRLVFGVLSILLLAAGLARAADRLDPMTDSLGAAFNSSDASLSAMGCTDPCVSPCWDDGNSL